MSSRNSSHICTPDAPNRVKKELDAVFGLQERLEQLEKDILDARKMVSNLNTADTVSDSIVNALHDQQKLVVRKIDELYASLNIQESFPELQGLDLEFVRTLLLLRDLKRTIRQRAVSSFFEWDKINQAKGGRGAPIGI